MRKEVTGKTALISQITGSKTIKNTRCKTTKGSIMKFLNHYKKSITIQSMSLLTAAGANRHLLPF